MFVDKRLVATASATRGQIDNPTAPRSLVSPLRVKLREAKFYPVFILAVGVFPPKGGDTYADYFDIPYRADYSNDSNSEKKQQPPLGQVTVVCKIYTQLS